LQQHIGVGQAAILSKIEITWPVTGKTQVFKNIPVDKNINITEDDSTFSAFKLTRFNFTKKMGQNQHHH
jgi:hypothetical protein